jgi:hypothetical protein
MGYACPVCGDPQADDVHLANHLAFTALSRGGDHEEWLDETVPEWGSFDETTLAAEVTAHAEETEYPQVFEDTTGAHDHDGRGHAHGRTGETRDVSEAMLAQAEAELDDMETRDTEDVLDKARELTEKRHDDEDSETE